MNKSKIDIFSNKIIGCAMEVHKNLGPGLLESTYSQCLAYELNMSGINFKLEYPIPVKYKTVNIDCSYRADFMVENEIIVEIKSVKELLPIHEAQLLTYLKISDKKLGLLINFNVKLLKKGLKRIVNKL